LHEWGGDVDLQAVESVAAAPESPTGDAHETGRRRFVLSWQWALILAVALAAGVIVIVAAHPFAGQGQSVSQRVSAAVGEQASCSEVGAATLAGGQSKLYRCVVGREEAGLVRCFASSGGGLRQFVDSRVGC
jgi:hypothetical protein